EPNLSELIQKNTANNRLQFTTNSQEAIEHAELLFIAVGTPSNEDGSADLQHVLAVADSIAEHMQTPKIVINKSTVPVGTADKVRANIKQKLKVLNKQIDFEVVSNPEFLKEGAAITDFMKPDRIIIGASNDDAAKKVHDLYAPFNRNHDRIFQMDVRSAELTKYAANAMLATKISFMNELANLAEYLDADIEQVRIGIGADSRIGYSFIYPGCGYGGSCFPKDVRALNVLANEQGYQANIISAVEKTNEEQKTVLFNKVNHHFNGDLKNRVFALWGLSFKPNTDDMREAPSLKVINSLIDAGATVQAHDPIAMGECAKIYGENDKLILCETESEALKSADALIIVTEWQQYRTPDFEKIKLTLKQPVIFDGRNIYNPQNLAELGITYYAIGRGEKSI
ncbi:MAG: UDP-glucose/GDP-mannose dehydrogenase family protein, partial [Cycloclasticus sp.]|nr:UDP-glucose/GDP-mannose dehydrogenase family protein [Cycloclasticus sp.]